MKKPLDFTLNSISKEEFIDKYYQKKALHIPGNEDKFKDLFSSNSLNRILNSVKYPHPTIKMSHKGRQFKPSDPASFINAVQQGASLIIEHIDRYDLNLGHFLSRFTQQINEETRFNMYLSQPDNQAYRNHYDTQDFFIFQVAGYKEWWIFPETIESVMFTQKTHGDEPPPESSLYLNCVLGPGDVLYVPRGHWHYALARKEPSLHLTLAMFVKTGIDFIKWLADELTEYGEFRKSLPLIISSSDNINGDIPISVFKELKSKLLKVLDEDDLLDRFLDYRVATSRDRQPFNFPNHTSFQKSYSTNSTFVKRSQRARVFIDEVNNKTIVVSSGRTLTFKREAENIIRFIFSSNRFVLQDILSVPNELSQESIDNIILLLLREGFIIGI